MADIEKDTADMVIAAVKIAVSEGKTRAEFIRHAEVFWDSYVYLHAAPTPQASPAQIGDE